MSFEELRSALVSGEIAGYMVQRLNVRVDLAKAFGLLSSAAQSFVTLVAGSDNKVHDIEALHAAPWSANPRILAKYSTLSADQRVEALVFFTLPLHEYLHHVDMLQTPFGAMFHLSAAREYAAFEQFAQLLVRTGPNAIPPGRMIDFKQWLKGGNLEIGADVQAQFDILARELQLMESWGDFDRVNSAMKAPKRTMFLRY